MVGASSTEALILDFDGVIVDSMAAKSEAASAVLSAAGAPIPAETFDREYAGWRIHESFEAILEDYGQPTEDVDTLVRRREEIVAEALSSGGIPLVDGILDLLEGAARIDVPVVVATGSRREYAETAIRHHRLDRYLSGLVSAYDSGVERGKPEPDVFIVAARSCGANPSNCLAVEDGMPGFLAALRAGMRCYYLAAANRADLPEEARDAMDQGRAAIITSLREVAL